MAKYLLAPLILTAILALTSCQQNGGTATPGPGMMGTMGPNEFGTPGPGMMSTPESGARFASNGERIYFAATSDSGQSIDFHFQGGTPMGMMNRMACVDCHGPEGHGGRVTLMMQSFETPAIIWHELTEGAHEGEQGEAGHPPYTEETVRRAITEGVNPAGEELEPQMPRWSMSTSDLDDLVGFLKTLE